MFICANISLSERSDSNTAKDKQTKRNEILCDISVGEKRQIS